MRSKKIKLLLLPYAGGSGLFYSHWAKTLDENITLVPIELPGRGLRFREELCKRPEEAIEKIFDFVKEEVKDSEYAIFGYCVGTILVYELYKKIVQEKLKEPLQCILCANPTPDVKLKDKKLSDKTEDEQVEEWLAGSQLTKEEVEKKPYLKKFFQVWLTDCEMMNGYIYREPKCSFNCKLTLISGRDDYEFAPEDVVCDWSRFAGKGYQSFVVDGTHEFLKTNEQEVINIVNKVLR